MGIYPDTKVIDRIKHPDGSETWTEVFDDYSGCIRTRKVRAEPYEERWETCYCCSCDERDGDDHYCRNHGSHGPRACDAHKSPGDTQLATVQEKRAGKATDKEISTEESERSKEFQINEAIDDAGFNASKPVAKAEPIPEPES